MSARSTDASAMACSARRDRLLGSCREPEVGERDSNGRHLPFHTRAVRPADASIIAGRRSAPGTARAVVLSEVRDDRRLVFVLDRRAPCPHLRHRSTPGRGVLPLLRDQSSAVAQQAPVADERLPGAIWKSGDLSGFRRTGDRLQAGSETASAVDTGASASSDESRREERGDDRSP